MKKFQIVLAIILGLYLSDQLSWAATGYVTDSFKITLRTGPGTENRIVTMLSSGEPLEILEIGDEWTRVRRLKPEGRQEEGWVLSRFLIDRQPWELQVGGLSRENASLKEKLTLIEKRLRESSRREAELQRELETTSKTLKEVQAGFDSLRNESSDFIQLKERHEVLQSNLETTEKTVQRLTQENKDLKSSQKVRWFLAGALVFLSALLIGLIAGRREKKRRPSLIHRSW